MLKLSPNAIGMLSAKYHSVLKKMLLKNSAVLAAGSLIFCASPVDAATNNYDIGTGPGQITLEELRQQVEAGTVVFQDGDTVTIHTADTGSMDNPTTNPLNNPLDFQDKEVEVKPVNPNSNIRFFELIGKTAEIANDSGVTVTGFSVTGNGGAVVLDMGSTFKAGDIEFSDNTSSTTSYYYSYGGAIYLSDNSSFTADTATFSGNNVSSSTISNGGAICLSDNSSFTADTATFSDNSISFSTTGTFAYGGAAYLSNSRFTANTATFSGNTISAPNLEANLVAGGAIHLLSNSSFTANTATFSGNAISSSAYTSYGGAAYLSNSSLTADTATFSGNTVSSSSSSAFSIVAGGAMYLSYGSRFTASTATFYDNTASSASAYTSYGGAVILDNNSSFTANTATFYDNTASSTTSSSGGAVYLNSGSFSADTATFSGNTASSSSSSSGGAVHIYNDSSFSADTAIFSDNTALADVAYGGAVYLVNSSFTADIANFFGNKAFSSSPPPPSYGGGAVHLNFGRFTADTATFSGNKSSYHGGAVSSSGNSSFTVDTANFYNNEAINGNGGAIYAVDNLTLNANHGNYTFQGNIASGEPNAIYMYNNSNNKKLTLSAKDGYSILFYDPVKSNSASNRRNLIISINETTDDTGKVLFDTYQSEVYGNTTVHNGTMALTNGAIYGANSGNPSFTLKADATLLSDTQSNAVKADNITLETDSTLAFDMDGAIKEGTPGETTNLTFTGTNFSGQAIGAGNIDVFSTNPLANGIYTLVKSTSPGANFANNGILNYNGLTVTPNGRLSTAFSLFTDNTTKLQLSIGDLGNTILTWKGYDTTAPTIWNQLDKKNWDGNVGGNAVTQFLNNDTVKFEGDGPGDVVIDNSGVTVVDMEVDNPYDSDYTFKDGDITVTGTLTKDGEGAITFENANIFSNNINLNEGRINIGNDQALGTVGLIMQNGTTLGFTGDHSIDNDITIEQPGTAIFDVESLNTNAIMTGNISGGGFEKTGAGELTIGDGGANVESFTVSEGTLKIAADKTLVVRDSFSVADNATLSVNAGQPGQNPAVVAYSVDFDSGSVINVSGYSGRALGDTVTLVTSENEIVDMTNHYTIGGNVNVDYLTAQVRLSENKQEVLADVALTWYDPHQNEDDEYDQAHGTFTINGAANHFTLNTELADRTGIFTHPNNWDGTKLTKDGTGKLILAGDNIYTGGTVIENGKIVAQSNGSLGTNQVEIEDNGVLTLNFDNEVFGNELIGNGGLNIGGNIEIARDNSSFYGKTNINADKTLTLKQETALGLSEINIIDTGFLSLGFNGTFGNKLTGGANSGLNIDGEVIINRDNSGFNGDTVISQNKKLTLGNVNALGTSKITNNATLEFDIQSPNGVFNNLITTTNNGELIKSGAGQLTLSNTGNNYSGKTIVESGTLEITAPASGLLNFGEVHNDSRLKFSNSNSGKNITVNSYSGNGVVELQAELSAEKQWADLVTFTTTPAANNAVNVHFYFMPNSDMKYMPSGGLRFAHLNNNDGKDNTFRLDGTSGLYGAYQLSIRNNNNQDYYLMSKFSPKQSKIYSEAAAADLAQAAWMQGNVLFKTISQAASLAAADEIGISTDYGNSNARHETGSHADIRGNNLSIAMGWKANEKTAYGIFGELFNGSYDAECDSEGRTISASGDMKLHVVGLFAKYRPGGDGDGHYYQTTVSAGRSSNEFHADNAVGGSNFKSGRRLSGASLGGGYLKTISPDRSAEYYSHLIYTRLGADKVTDSLRQEIQFDSASSFRLMSGMRLNFNQNKKTSAYLGAALDYEFGGSPNVYINGNKAAAANLHGLSGLIELGLVSKQSKTLNIDLGLQGWAGKKKGLSGTLTLSKRF